MLVSIPVSDDLGRSSSLKGRLDVVIEGAGESKIHDISEIRIISNNYEWGSICGFLHGLSTNLKG